MRVVHISDTHGPRGHNKLIIPECDVLFHTGDIGGRTNPFELLEFLVWFAKQPAKHKVFIAGNHDICLDKKYADGVKEPIVGIFAKQKYKDAIELIESYKNEITYLENSGCEIEGFKIWGSPYSPSFHREHWVFNADRGEEISKQWAKIPKDTEILLTHTPIYNVFDYVGEKYANINEEMNVGCKDLERVIHKRLTKLKLHLCGHIHDQLGIVTRKVSNSRHIMFSNGAVLTNEYKQLITTPCIINLNK